MTLQCLKVCPNVPTGSRQRQVVFSHGPSHASAADLEQTSGSERRYGSGGTWCWGQSCKITISVWWNAINWHFCPELCSPDTHYTPSWTSVPSHQPHPEKTCNTLGFTNPHNNIFSTFFFFLSDAVLICFTYHCNIGISPVAIVTMVNKAGRLTRENSQCLFWQQSPGCQHDFSFNLNVLEKEIWLYATEPLKTFDGCNIDLEETVCIYTTSLPSLWRYLVSSTFWEESLLPRLDWPIPLLNSIPY